MRDLLANKETENKNLHYLLQRESELSHEKAYKEEEALHLLNDDLNFQLKAIEQQNEATGGLVTPLRMEEMLRRQSKASNDSLQQILEDSVHESEATQRELSQLQSQLEKELHHTAMLEEEKRQKFEEVQRLGAEYSQLENELKELTDAFEGKQRELDDLRVKAGDDARKLAIELSQAQQTTNVLFLEVKKFEGLHRFMDLERDLIMKAQKDAEGLNPAVSALDVEQAEARQRELEN